MIVELLWWAGCPSTEPARALLRGTLAELGHDPGAVTEREMPDEAAAEREAFVGSPTIRVDGRDVAPPPPGTPTSLSCRLYHRRDGRVSPLPDPADLRAALQEGA